MQHQYVPPLEASPLPLCSGMHEKYNSLLSTSDVTGSTLEVLLERLLPAEPRLLN